MFRIIPMASVYSIESLTYRAGVGSVKCVRIRVRVRYLLARQWLCEGEMYSDITRHGLGPLTERGKNSAGSWVGIRARILG